MKSNLLVGFGLLLGLAAACSGSGTSSSAPASANVAPVARGGGDQSATEGDVISLDGSQSSDADGVISSYSWRQVSGGAVTLTGASSATASFQAPEVVSGAQLTFELTVTDDDGGQSLDTIAVNIDGADTRVLTAEGFVEGHDVGNDIVAFQGVPFAKPPVAALRWRAPEPADLRSEVLETKSYAPACFQPEGELASGYTPSDNMSEDCLYLNIWTDDASEASRLPVMVWIHGGGNLTGGASQPAYDGQKFAQQGVVLVSIQYRLGAMGYMAHPELTAEAQEGASGNYGTQDIIAALEWVQDNIEKFGGDPDSVTIFGESAGSVNSCAMIASPQAAGLFHGAIMQSGACGAELVELQTASASGASAESVGQSAADALGCGNAVSEVDCMRDLEPSFIYETLEPADAFFSDEDSFRFGLIIDGATLPDAPLSLIQAGNFNRVPVIVGSNENEAGFWRLQINSIITGVTAYQFTLETLFDDDADLVINGPAADVLAAYPATTRPEARAAFERLFTDSVFTCPARRDARAFDQNGISVWRYEFTWLTPGVEALGAFHAAEIPYVFGNLDSDPSTQGRALSDNMMRYWVNFAATGDPNDNNIDFWPAYLTATDRHLVLDEPLSTGFALRESYCDLLDSIN